MRVGTTTRSSTRRKISLWHTIHHTIPFHDRRFDTVVKMGQS